MDTLFIFIVGGHFHFVFALFENGERWICCRPDTKNQDLNPKGLRWSSQEGHDTKWLTDSQVGLDMSI